MEPIESIKPVKRLNTTLPDPLAYFVAEITGDGGLYETPTEFVRDLIRRYMERTQQSEHSQINAMLAQSVAENRYSAWQESDLDHLIKEIDS